MFTLATQLKIEAKGYEEKNLSKETIGGIYMNYEAIEQELAELPLYIYAWVDPQSLEFSDRVRHICQTECAMYGKSWACPPGVGSVETCQEKCMRYKNCLMIATVTEVPDIADINQTLATRADHEDITNQVGGFFREQGVELCAVHRVLRHLPPVRHFRRSPLPPPGTDAPLRGKSGHQHYSHAGALRDRVPVRGQCCDVDFFAAFLKKCRGSAVSMRRCPDFFVFAY